MSDEFVLNVETHLDGIPTLPFGPEIPSRWWHGTLFGFDSMIRSWGIKLNAQLRGAGSDAVDWYDELLRFVNPGRKPDDWPSRRCGLSEFAESSFDQLRNWFGLKRNTTSPKSRLEATLGSESVHLMSSNDADACHDLEIVLAGAVAAHPDEKVKMILATHSVTADSLVWVSVAIRIPRYGQLTNRSRWYVFYKMYHEGQILDSEVGFARAKVTELLTIFQDNLDVEELCGLHDEDLFAALHVTCASCHEQSETPGSRSQQRFAVGEFRAFGGVLAAAERLSVWPSIV